MDAAHRLLNRRGGTSLTLLEVAAEAAVSRATIYKSVGSRARLLAAVFEDQGRLIGFERVLTAMALEDPGEAIVATVRESCRAWSVMPQAIRTTLALAALDEEIGGLVRTYERYRRARLAALVRRWNRSRAPAARLPLSDAAATLALLTSFTTFDQLRGEDQARRATGRLVDLTSLRFGIPLSPSA